MDEPTLPKGYIRGVLARECAFPNGDRVLAMEVHPDCPHRRRRRARRAMLNHALERLGSWQHLPAGEGFVMTFSDQGVPRHFPAEEPDPAVIEALADGLRPTDSGNADRLLVFASERLRFVHAWGKFVVWDEGRWVIDFGSVLATEMATEAVHRMFRTAIDRPPQERDAMLKWAKASESKSAIQAMTVLVRGRPGMLVDHERFDADPCLLNVRNGTVDLRTGELRPHNPEDLLTMQAPVLYDATATAPLWDECLRTWQPDPQMRWYLQRMIGSGATGFPVELLLINHGQGANGKSKCFGAVTSTLGPYAVIPHKSLLVATRYEEHQTVVASLFRKRLLLAAETEVGASLNETQVKNLTGGDRLRARRMREDEWEFNPTWTAFLHTNHRPQVRSSDEGIWRRLRLVPWEVTIPSDQRDLHLAAKLAKESSGILNWIIAGAVAWLGGDREEPEQVEAATKRYRYEEDHIGRFIADCCVVDRSLTVLAAALGAEYSRWCEANGEADLGPRTLGLALGARGFEQFRPGGQRGWKGLTLKANR